VDEYVRYARSDSLEGECASLTWPRAAHTATLLEDGRVLLAGGFMSEPTGTPVALAEIFDPLSGSVSVVEEPSLRTPRAFHTATLLPGSKVLLAGGQVESVEGSLPLRSAQVLDLVKRTSTEVQLTAARSQHAAAVDSGGRVLLVGGVGAGGTVVAEAEGYEPATGQVFSVSTPVPRVGMSAMPVQDGRRIAVVGGSDGTSLRPEVLFFSFEGGSFVPVGEGAQLRQPRRDAALVPFGGPDRLLYVGGHDSPGGVEDARFLASSELVSPGAAAQVSPGPQVFARSGPCAVALPDGRVMTLGGLRSSSGGLVSDSHVELLVPGKDGAAPGLLGLKPLDLPRHQHSCTVLRDGSVLIAGGVEDTGTQRTTLDDLVVYMPAPLD
jgi:galactose oxidase-like protein